MPFATPYPLVRNRKRQGTITAGETAATIDPSKKKSIDEQIWQHFFIISVT